MRVYQIKARILIYKYENTYFTDDTVMTIAIGQPLLHNEQYEKAMIKLGRLYPAAGYGGNFYRWLHSEVPEPYNSWGNGSAMRVSPIDWAFDSEEAVLEEAKKSATAQNTKQLNASLYGFLLT